MSKNKSHGHSIKYIGIYQSNHEFYKIKNNGLNPVKRLAELVWNLDNIERTGIK